MSGKPIFIIDGSFYGYERLEYHSSWDWLMPVVEKVWLSFGGDFSIAYGCCNISGEHGQPSSIYKSCDSTIQATWEAVVEFITWFNSQPQIK
jgi:hypothetical protein